MAIQRILLLIVLWHVLDWNANQDNKVSFRFTRTHTKDSNFPTSSTNPLYSSDLYPGGKSNEVIDGKPVGDIAKGQGRTSKYALSFCEFQLLSSA